MTGLNIPYTDAPWIQVPRPEVMLTTKCVLNENDPFESVLINIVETNRRKRADYAEDGSPFSNFVTTAELLGVPGFDALEASLFNVCQKLARLKALRINGRMDNPANESVSDTYLDLAVYAIITYAIHTQRLKARRQAEMLSEQGIRKGNENPRSEGGSRTCEAGGTGVDH